MQRWLIILSLAMVQCPGLALASTRSSDVPFWERLLSVFTPRSTPAVRSTRREHAQHTRVLAVPSSPDPLPAQSNHEPHQSSRVVTAPSSPEPLPAQPIREPRQSTRVAVDPSSPEPPPAQPIHEPRKKSTDTGCNGGQRIISAYYWEGHHTASGQPFDPHGMTAAHRTLPFGTRLTVTNPRTGQSVSVVINDRGPFVSGVSLDLSLGAAQAIGMHGTGSVCISS
jgi:rare lipoprotein A